MPSVELTFAPEVDAAVRAEWALLAEAGVASQADHPSDSNAPHVTALFCTGDLDPFDAAPPAEPLVLGSPVLFPRRRGVVLARHVLVTRELLDWHRALHERVADLPDLDIEAHTRPGSWTPHVTLARVLPLADLPTALEALGTLPDLAAPVTEVRMWSGRTRTLTRLSRTPVDTNGDS